MDRDNVAIIFRGFSFLVANPTSNWKVESFEEIQFLGVAPSPDTEGELYVDIFEIKTRE